MKISSALLGGLAGAVTVTILHELMKQNVSNAPRMDKLGMESIEEGLEKADLPVPDKQELFGAAMVGELLTNSLYYALAGIGKRENATKKGSVLGLAAGLGSVLLPKPMGLNARHSNKTAKTQLLAMGLYLVGGLVASKVTEMLDREVL